MKPRNHKYADMIRRWLDDDSLVVEVGSPEGPFCETKEPQWTTEVFYRFKPRTIRIGDMEAPEPMRVAPIGGEVYWVVDLMAQELCTELAWNGADPERRWLSIGVCHVTKKAAIQHAKALIALTEVKQ